MSSRWTRRTFLRTTGAASLSLGAWNGLPPGPASAQDPKAPPDLVPLSPDIEPIARLLETTRRETCIEVLAGQIRRGLSHRQLTAALFLTGIRNFKPASSGAMHIVYAMHAVHQFSLDARPEERLLPFLWAVDQLGMNSMQTKQHGPVEPLAPLQGALPAAAKASDEFRAAMDEWDGDRAERAIVALARSRGVAEVADHLWPYGARDENQLGHKAIFLANAWRTLQVIGWQDAEIVLRSLSLALVSHHMKYKKAALENFGQQPYLANVERTRQHAARLPGDWATAQSDPGPTREMLAMLHDGRANDACDWAATHLVSGKVRAGSVWDAVHLAAAELLMRQPQIDGVHAITSTNALHYLFRTSGRTEHRLLILLQAIGWSGLFHRTMVREGLKDLRITELAPGEIPDAEEDAAREMLAEPAVKGSMATVDSWTAGSAPAKAFRYAQRYPGAGAFFREARRLVFRKGDDEHHYKFPAAIFEDYALVDPQWRPHLLAASVYYLRDGAQPDSPVMVRACEALGIR